MRQQVIYEFKEYTETQTLVLNNPAEVTFINQGVGGSVITINNVILIQPSGNVIAGIGDYQDRITLRPNLNETDTTDYNVKIPVGSKLVVICKYYRK
jgi:hypothetical protein